MSSASTSNSFSAFSFTALGLLPLDMGIEILFNGLLSFSYGLVSILNFQI